MSDQIWSEIVYGIYEMLNADCEIHQEQEEGADLKFLPHKYELDVSKISQSIAESTFQFDNGALARLI